MSLFRRARARLADSRRGPKCRCPRDGELFYAPGFFDLSHESTVDGVACGQLGISLAWEEEQQRIRAQRHHGGHEVGPEQCAAGGPAPASDRG